MRLSVRGFFALLLLLTAAFSGLACSGGVHSRISSADIDKLNAANETLRATAATLETKLKREVSRCAGKATLAKCTNKALVRLAPAMRSAAATAATAYEQVAADAQGVCRKALRTAAREFRAEAANGAVSPNNQLLLENWNALLSACKLKAN